MKKTISITTPPVVTAVRPRKRSRPGFFFRRGHTREVPFGRGEPEGYLVYVSGHFVRSRSKQPVKVPEEPKLVPRKYLIEQQVKEYFFYIELLNLGPGDAQWYIMMGTQRDPVPWFPAFATPEAALEAWTKRYMPDAKEGAA